jgi:hypothetical protein
LQLPNNASNLVADICYDNGGNLWGVCCCQASQPFNGITPLNCLIEWTTNGTFVQAVNLTEPVYYAQGISFNGSDFLVTGEDAKVLAAGDFCGFSLSYPVNGVSVVQEVMQTTGALVSGVTQVPNPTNSFLVATINSAIRFYNFSCTNLAIGIDAAGTTFIQNLLCGAITMPTGVELKEPLLYQAQFTGGSSTIPSLGGIVSTGSGNRLWIAFSNNFGVNLFTGLSSGAISGTGPLNFPNGFIGNGSGLSNLNASQLTQGAVPSAALTSVPAASLTGTIPDTLLSPNVALLGANQTFQGQNVFISNVGIGNSNPTNLLMVVNARCDGSSWINASDRNLKQDFAAVDARAVLEKVAVLPVQTWSYKAQPEQKHLGPVAQDFHAAFGLGMDDVSISTVDEGGVALAAIQGLNQKLNEKDAEIQELKQSVDQLKKLVQLLGEKK